MIFEPATERSLAMLCANPCCNAPIDKMLESKNHDGKDFCSLACLKEYEEQDKRLKVILGFNPKPINYRERDKERGK